MESKTIGVVGLGLMGASLCKALGAQGHKILGKDTDEHVLKYALLTGTIQGELTEDNVPECDYLFLAVYPGAAVETLKQLAPKVRKDAVVSDLCGVKKAVCEPCFALAEEYGYVPYGQKHFEDLITKFLEGWWQPTRFGHDIRRAQLSSLVVTGQMSRDEALEILKTPPLSEEESKQLFSEVAEKLRISEAELMCYHNMPECTEKFRSQEKLYKLGIKLYEKIGIEKRIRK